MTTISTTKPVVTLINVFTVMPEKQQELVEVLIRALDEVLRHLPGYVSSNIHQSLDGTQVVDYAQWESQEAFEAIFTNPAAMAHIQQAAAIATAAPQLYRVVHTDASAISP